MYRSSRKLKRKEKKSFLKTKNKTARLGQR